MAKIFARFLKLAAAFFCSTLMMNSPSGDNDTLELFFNPKKQLDIGEDDKILQRLQGRAWIDSNRIAELERQVKRLRIQLYAFAVITCILAIAITLILVRAT
jgi:hypothetical protein